MFYSQETPEHRAAQRDIDDSLQLIRRITTRVISACLDELDIVYGAVGTAIQHKCQKVIDHMQYDEYKIDENGKLSDKIRQRRFVIRPTDSKDAVPILKAVKEITKELWDSDLSKQFDYTWEKVIKHMLPSLPAKWTNAMSHRQWKSEFESLLKFVGFTKVRDYKYKIKCLLIDGLSRSILCVHVWKTLVGKYHPGIKDNLARSKSWTPHMYEQFGIFLIKNWDELLKRFWSPSKLLDVHCITDCKLLGLRFLKISLYMYYSELSMNRFKNLKSFVKSNVDVSYYGFGSQIEGIHYPDFLVGSAARHRELKDLIWNIHEDQEHSSMKNDYFGILLFRGIFQRHEKQIYRVYGTAEYTNDKGILSDVVVNGATVAERATAVFTSFKSDWSPLGKVQVDAIHSTIDSLGKISMYSNPQFILGICRKVREMAEESFVSFIV